MPYIAELTSLCKELNCTIIPNCSLKEYTTFRIGGICKALISVNNTESVAILVKFLQDNNAKFTVIGKGSNLLVSDDGYDGIILYIGKDFSEIRCEGDVIYAQAGAKLSAVCLFAQQNGLTGIENLYGIPGTIGGAIYMNAGAYGCEIADVAVSATYINESGNAEEIIFNKETDFSYRHSFFTQSKKIICDAKLKLTLGDPEEILKKMNDCMTKRKTNQPLDKPSAGSMFKRPVGSYASLLIEQCGLKGFTVGGAQVSEKHSGFVVNIGGATCDDVLKLCKKVKDVVFEKTGYILETEPIYLA